MTAHPTASDRMRATRARRRRGAVLVEIEVDAALLGRLIGLKMLTADQRTDRSAVGAAVLASSGPRVIQWVRACWRSPAIWWRR